MATELNNETFQSEVLDYKEGKVLVDFYAPWCGPCQMMGPILDELANELEGSKAKVFKVNVDEQNELAGKYNVMSIPTLIIFENGEPKETMMGVQQKDSLKSMLEN